MSSLDRIVAAHPGLADKAQAVKKNKEDKLWHQFSTAAADILNQIDEEQLLRPFYEEYIAPVELKLNLLQLAQFVVKIAQSFANVEEGRALVQSTMEKAEPRDRDAFILCKCELARYELQRGESRKCRDMLEECESLLNNAMGVDNVVFSTYYRVYCLYLKDANKPSEFYRNALLFLAYTPLETIALNTQQLLAFDIGVAAILGEDIYNFGELLASKIVETLNGTDGEWLAELLKAFNDGNVAKYEETVQKYQAQLLAQSALVQRAGWIKQKMYIMSLMELVFTRGTSASGAAASSESSSVSRSFSFSEIASHLQLSEEDIEFHILKALAFGVIRGSIDQVARTVDIEWVQPRVLSRGQIEALEKKYASWIQGVQDTLVFMQTETPELSI